MKTLFNKVHTHTVHYIKGVHMAVTWHQMKARTLRIDLNFY